MENVCRTCLRNSTDLVPLFKQEELVLKILEISSVLVEDLPGYPTNICSECVRHTKTLFNFRKVIINCDFELKIRVKNNLVTKTEIQNIKNEVLDESETNHLDDPLYQPLEEPKTPEKENKPKQRKARAHGLKGQEKACNECDKIFDSRIKLYNHRRTVHVKPGICTICGQTVRVDNLRKHMLVHSETPVKCKVCGKEYKNTESLRGHLLIHQGYTYHCGKCGKPFKVRSEYQRHMKKHLDPDSRKYMCTLCGKKVGDLRKHMYSHTGERPHLCKVCNKGFTSSYSLKVHSRGHTNQKPFICHQCPTAFRQKVSLMTHLKSKHGEEEQRVETHFQHFQINEIEDINNVLVTQTFDAD